MKTKILAACLLISLLLSSCTGVKQEEYDALKTQKEALEKQNDSLSEELESWTMGDAALTTMCSQIKDGTTYCILNGDTVMFVLPVDIVAADEIAEAYNAIIDYAPVLNAAYNLYTSYEKFVYRVQNENNAVIMEVCVDYTSGSAETSVAYNALYQAEMEQVLATVKN